MNTKHFGVLLSGLMISGAVFAADPAAAPATQPGITIDTGATYLTPPAPSTQPAAAAKTNLLGPEFSSDTYGLAFRPPLDCTEVHKPGPDNIVEFDQDKKQWIVIARQVEPPHAIPLTIHKDQFGKDQEGLLEQAIRGVVKNTPDAEIIEDAGGVRIFNVGRNRVGGIFARFTNAKQERKLLLEAIVEVPDAGGHLYYFIDFIANARPIDAKPDDVDPGEKEAYETFSQMIDSIQVLDRKVIFDDQKQRLTNSHDLFIDWSGNHGEPLKKILLPDQWQRIIKDGKDIGYSHTSEYVTDFIRSPDGTKQIQIKNVDDILIHVDTRSRIFPTPGSRWDTGTWSRVSSNRRDESWASVVRGGNAKGDVQSDLFQIGSSHINSKLVDVAPPHPVNGMLSDGIEPEKNKRNVQLMDVRSLIVKTTLDKSDLDPFKQDTPAFYVPQAISTLLPRLLPLNRPDHDKNKNEYMFATFVATPWTDVGKEKGGGRIMARYLDVLPIQQVTFNGQVVEAIPVTDHIGRTGPVTTNYLTPDGKFLGSVCTYSEGKDSEGVEKKTSLMIVSSTIEEIEKLWNKADIDIPREAPNEAADPAAGFSSQSPAAPVQ